jgi:peptide/nickel transport system substrate-binding protein
MCSVLAGCTKVGTTGPMSEGAGGPPVGRHPWTRPGELRIGIQTAPNTLNPLLAANTTEGMIDRLLFDVLVTVDETGRKTIPVLAAQVPTLDNGGISKDRLTITYHLRRGVRWHDGAPFTSKDVAFSWRAIMNDANNVISRTGYELVRSVETPDDDTVVFHMKQRFAPTVNTLFAESDDPYHIVPAHLLARLPNINDVPFNSAPIGTGPFKLERWVRGDHLELVANGAYFLGKPKLKDIVLKIIPDENTELNALRTHDIDWQFEASPQEYKDLKLPSDTKVVLQDRNEYERIQVNTKHPPLDDVRVRQALSYAIDRQRLVGDLTYGSAAVADGDLPSFMWAHATDVTRYSYDLAKAKRLMAQAGWAPGRDGVLTKDGRKLALTIATNNTNATRRLAVVQVQSMLRALGIDLEPKFYLGSLLFATMGQGGILQNGKFDLAWTGWVAGIDPDQSSLFVCSAQPPNGNNESLYCNPALDAAERSALTNFEVPVRKAAYARLEAILTRDLPVLPIWWPRQIQPINPDFTHFRPNPVTASWNAYQWEI